MDSMNFSGTFYIKPVKESDSTLRLEDILEDPVVIYSRESTQTTLMKCKYKGINAVAKIFKVNTKAKAQSIIDNEVRFQSCFKDIQRVVQVYD